MGNLISRNVRLSTTIAFFLVSATLLTITVSFFAEASVIYVVGISTASSGLAATLIELVSQITERIERISNQRRFLRLFGCNEKAYRNNTTAIVIPAFNLNASSNKENKNSKMKRAAETVLPHFNTRAAIRNDVKAASYIVSAFSRLGLPIPEIKWDEDIDLEREQTIQNYILLGLSNTWLDLLEGSDEKYFSVSRSSENVSNFLDINIKIGLFDRGNRLLTEDRWIKSSVSLNSETHLPDNAYDYALFAKLRRNGKNIVICGGCTEFSTRDVGIYISSDWRRIYTDLRNEKGNTLDANEGFAIAFQFPFSTQLTGDGQRAENVSVANKCIKKVRTKAT